MLRINSKKSHTKIQNDTKPSDKNRKEYEQGRKETYATLRREKIFIIAQAQPHTQIYTDTFIFDQKVGAAIICGDTEVHLKLSDKCSIYIAETLAILEAVKYFSQFVDDKRCIILSDSLSVITSLENIVNPSDIARNIQNSCHIARSAGKHISFMWIPGHSNIAGNEKANELQNSHTAHLKPSLFQDSLTPTQNNS